MATPFLAELRIFSFGFAPKGWALCNGQLMPINQNQALFALLGTTYGGDGRTTFALPNLQSRVPIHMGNGHVLGERGGQESHTLIVSEMPAHSHTMQASNADNNALTPIGNNFAKSTELIYGALTNPTPILGDLQITGGSQPHNNMQPYSVLNFCIALQGTFPSQN